MSEFGHIYVNGGGICIDVWGSGPFLIEVDGKKFRFEDSDRFGPYLVAKDGRVLDNQPGSKSPFWKAHWMWRKGGRRLDPDGQTAIWDRWKPTIYKRIIGRNFEVVENGDHWGGEPLESIFK